MCVCDDAIDEKLAARSGGQGWKSTEKRAIERETAH